MLLVEEAQAHAVTYTEQRRLRRLLQHELIHETLIFLVERGRRFIEENPCGLEEQDLGEGEPLLLTRRERVRPVLLLIEIVSQRLKAHAAQRFSNRAVGDSLS